MRTFMLVLALAVAATAHAGDSDSLDSVRLEHELQDRKYARIGVAGNTYVAVKPRVGPEGLEFDRVESMVLRRPSITMEDPGAPPTSPIPWTQIVWIDSGERTRGRSTLIGASIGLVTGALLGASLASYAPECCPAPDAARNGAVVGGAILGVVGAGIGALLPATKWNRVYPETTDR